MSNNLYINNNTCDYNDKGIEQAEKSHKIKGVIVYLLIPYLLIGAPLLYTAISTENILTILLMIPGSIFFSIPGAALMALIAAGFLSFHESTILKKQREAYFKGLQDGSE